MSVPVLNGTEKENLPSGVVVIAILLPRTVSDALARGEPSSADTFPAITRFCADTCTADNKIITKASNNLHIWVRLNKTKVQRSYGKGGKGKGKKVVLNRRKRKTACTLHLYTFTFYLKLSVPGRTDEAFWLFRPDDNGKFKGFWLFGGTVQFRDRDIITQTELDVLIHDTNIWYDGIFHPIP